MAQRGRVIAEMVGERPATARLGNALKPDPEALEHARGRLVRCRGRGGLDAAVEHEHRACFAVGRADRADGCAFGRCPDAVWRCGRSAAAGRDLCAERRRQGGSQHPADEEESSEPPPVRHDELEQPAREPLPGGPPDLPLDQIAADVEQAAVFDARRAGGFAVAAGQAAVEMGLRPRRDIVTFEQLPDQVDAPARAVAFVAEFKIRRAGRVAESAMHAGTQDRIGFVDARHVGVSGCDPCLHPLAATSSYTDARDSGSCPGRMRS